MDKIINYDNLRNFAYSNDSLCSGKIQGIIVSFFGLGIADMYSTDTFEGEYYAKHNIIYLVPYTNPWAWMNNQSIAYTDEVVDVIMKHYNLPKDIPIASVGASMGGLGALVYMVYAKYTPVVCVANCPVCDLPYHFTERPDLPRTIYSAIYNEPGDFQDVLKAHSPLHLIDKMPNADYYIFHCENDSAVKIDLHSDPFVNKMKSSHRITYHVVPARGHCQLTLDMFKLYLDYPLIVIQNHCFNCKDNL